MDQHAEGNHALMLDIARDAIQQRVAREGCTPKDCDAERDVLPVPHQQTHKQGGHNQWVTSAT